MSETRDLNELVKAIGPFRLGHSVQSRAEPNFPTHVQVDLQINAESARTVDVLAFIHAVLKIGAAATEKAEAKRRG